MTSRVLLSVLTFFMVCPVFAADYSIDSGHSSVGFKVRHLGISSVTGRFDNFEGNFSYDPKNVAQSKTDASIDLSSVNTNQTKRDNHLKDCDFFCVKDFAKMSFKSKKVLPKDGNKFQLVGDLTIKGVTKEITLDAEFLGEAKDPMGNTRAAFTANGTLNRKDFGLTWDKLTEAGGLIVGHDVAISIEIEGVKKA